MASPSSPSSPSAPVDYNTLSSSTYSMDETLLKKSPIPTVYQTPITASQTVDSLQSPPSAASSRDGVARP